MLEQAGRPIDALCAAVGTARLLAATAAALKTAGSTAKIIALEPASSAFLTTGVGGRHRVEGTGAGMIPPLLIPDTYDAVLVIDEDEPRAVARRLAREERVFAGNFTRLNVTAALRLAADLGPGHTVATVACDSGLKYLAGDLFSG